MKIILRIVIIALQYKWHLLAAYICTIGASTAYLLLPKFIGRTVDGHGAILPMVLVIVGLYVVRGLFSFWQTYLGEALSHNVAYDLRNTFYDHVQRLSFRFHDQHHTGNLMSRVISDVENIRMSINMGLVRTPYFLGLFVAVAIILLRLDWQLGLVSIGFLPFIGYQSSIVRLKIRRVWLVVQEKMAELSTVLQENLTGVRVVKAYGSENFEGEKFDTHNEEVAANMIEAERLRSSSTALMLFSFLAALGIVLWFGGWRVMNGDMTLGELAQFIIYMQMLAMPVRMCGWIVNAYARAASSGQRLFEILDLKPEVTELENAKPLRNIKGRVKFHKVHFSYDGELAVLKEVEFEAEPGKMIALLGPPGSGKTTIINLIPRFYDVSSGYVTIDEVDVREIKLSSLRRMVGVVQQDVFLFTSTIRQNIAYGLENAPFDRIVQAAKLAQFHDFVESLEDGYDTVISERGATLSGGQRQRLSIARAILLDPPILILDDSTSSVDTVTEELIRSAMEKAMSGRTTFVIAHRLSTVHKANEIIVMEGGRIAEQGTHHQLLALGGAYREIYELQLRPQEEKLLEGELQITPNKRLVP